MGMEGGRKGRREGRRKGRGGGREGGRREEGRKRKEKKEGEKVSREEETWIFITPVYRQFLLTSSSFETLIPRTFPSFVPASSQCFCCAFFLSFSSR